MAIPASDGYPGETAATSLAGAGASSPGHALLCVHTFLLLLLFTGRKSKFPAEEVAAQSPEAGG